MAALSITFTPVLGADLVFKGKVLKQRGKPNGGMDPIVYTFRVSQAYKGHVHRTENVRTNGSSAACGAEDSGDVLLHRVRGRPRLASDASPWWRRPWGSTAASRCARTTTSPTACTSS